MRYSVIVGEAYYRIGLSSDQYSLVDAYFLAASHHRYRSLEADDLRNAQYHQRLYWLHLKALYRVVERGQFLEAKDLSRRGMDRAQSWSPDRLPDCVSVLTDLDHTALAHENMFRSMSYDPRFEAGENHPYDELLGSSTLKPADFNLVCDPIAA